jgi:serine phosphatase RsbU (regulator of sigma subunit)
MRPARAWDRPGLERILAPLADDPRIGTLRIEAPDGTVLAGALDPDTTVHPKQACASIVIGGEVVGQLIAEPATAPDGEVPTQPLVLEPAVESLALAIGDLLAERSDHEDARRALDALRSAAMHEAAGTDTVELAKARHQQRSIVSLVAPDVPGYDLASHYAAAREIGGDFFEFFRLARRGHPLGIVIADVTGKGIDAALLMAFSRPVMHTALNAASGPADALERTNRVLVGEQRATLFITAVCAVLHPRTGIIRIANAGHEPPLLVPSDGGPVRPVGDAGVLLGAFGTLHAPEVTATLAAGDVLVFYTDGATDAVDPSGVRFGDDRLLAAIEAGRGGTAHELVAAIRDALDGFRASTEPADDLTIAAIGRQRRRPPGRPAPDSGS